VADLRRRPSAARRYSPLDQIITPQNFINKLEVAWRFKDGFPSGHRPDIQFESTFSAGGARRSVLHRRNEPRGWFALSPPHRGSLLWVHWRTRRSPWHRRAPSATCPAAGRRILDGWPKTNAFYTSHTPAYRPHCCGCEDRLDGSPASARMAWSISSSMTIRKSIWSLGEVGLSRRQWSRAMWVIIGGRAPVRRRYRTAGIT